MSYQDELQKRIVLSLKNPQDYSLYAKHRAFLRLAKGELQSQAARQNKPLTTEQETKILQKLVASNEETISKSHSEEQRITLQEENNLLRELLPRMMNKEEVIAALSALQSQISEAKSEGQAIGLAMKCCKEQGLACDGNLVREVVQEWRQ